MIVSLLPAPIVQRYGNWSSLFWRLLEIRFESQQGWSIMAMIMFHIPILSSFFSDYYTKCICDAHLRGVINFIKKGTEISINERSFSLSRSGLIFNLTTFSFLLFNSTWIQLSFLNIEKERNWDYNKMWFSIVWQVDMKKNYLHCVIGADNGNIHSSDYFFCFSVFTSLFVEVWNWEFCLKNWLKRQNWFFKKDLLEEKRKMTAEIIN